MKLKRPITVLAASLMLGGALAACSSSGGKSGSGNTGGSSGGASSSSGPDVSAQPKSQIKAATMTGDCAPYGKYGKYSGKTVTMYASITDPEGGYLQQSWKKFEQCTGITIAYTGDKEFESAIKTKVQGGNAPDIAIMPQPGLLQSFATAGKLKP